MYLNIDIHMKPYGCTINVQVLRTRPGKLGLGEVPLSYSFLHKVSQEGMRADACKVLQICSRSLMYNCHITLTHFVSL